MHSVCFLLALASTAQAFPRMVNDPKIWARVAEVHEHYNARAAEAQGQQLDKRLAEATLENERMWEEFHLSPRDNPLGISQAETNCGPVPCPTFSESDQAVSITGQYVYQSPAVSDIRGPCPGLNAAANHGYLPRNGIASLEQTVSGLGALYNLGKDASVALAAYAIAVDGNVVEGVWSIGGPLPDDPITGPLVGTGQGLSYSHNNYEGDSSIGRNDAYTNNGDAHSLNITKFQAVYSLNGPEDRYTLDKFRQRFESVQDESIANNPYYFTGLFSTVVVVPAAYNFVINLMSNHSAEVPSGYLNGAQFKSFFGVAGKSGKFVWKRGQERVPYNWYRRPSYNPYNLQGIGGDVGIGYQAYPHTLKFGGNTGTPNSFVGVNVANLTGGAYNAQTLFQGNNIACLSYQLLQNGLPSFGKPAVGALGALLTQLNSVLSPVLQKLNCPQLQKFNQGLYGQFPGYHYNPTGNDTNY